MSPPTVPFNAGRISVPPFVNFREIGIWGWCRSLPRGRVFFSITLFQVFPAPGSSSLEKGGVSLFLLCGLPLLLFALALFSWRWAQLYDSKTLRGLCRRELKEGLHRAGTQIESLLKLNAQVRAHRREKKSAEVALKAALLTLNPKLILPAQAWMKKVALQEEVLRALQFGYLSRGRLELHRAQSRALRALRGESGHRGLAERTLESLRPLIQFPKLAVQIADAHHDLPEYELTPQFSERQKLELRWQSRFEERNSPWSLPRLRLPESCGMTLTSDLRPIPSQDKFFWRR